MPDFDPVSYSSRCKVNRSRGREEAKEKWVGRKKWKGVEEEGRGFLGETSVDVLENYLRVTWG